MFDPGPLTKHQYINLETFRKSGAGVKTPVWFVQDGGSLYVRTMANSGKVKRIRNNSQVKIAPCKGNGALLGDWLPATAREVKDQDTQRKVDRLLDQKYSLMKKMFALLSTVQGKEYTILQINLGEQ
jgi:hypothetical protein